MSVAHPPSRPPAIVNASVQAHARQGQRSSRSLFGITLYHPNYVLPAYYTFSPDRAVFRGQTPSGETIQRLEFKYQLSLKVIAVRRVAGKPLGLDFAYTQKSYWQAYDRSAFFRESDYQPEVFFNYRRHWALPLGWQWRTTAFGAVHQSNGKGGVMERSWNRLYLRATLRRGHWRLAVQPWLIIHDSTMREHNPDIGRYLGYGQWILSYRRGRQVVALRSRNTLASGFSRGFVQLSWSFPLIHQLRGYVQVSSGYGQSLIGYDHSTTALGIGLALNNW